MPNLQSPYKLYTPAIREPLPLRRKPYILPAPPEAPEKPPKMNWLQTLLPPFLMLAVLIVISSVVAAGGFIFYSMVMIIVYPIARIFAFMIQKNIYDKKEKERGAVYAQALEQADREIVSYIRKQREFLKREFLPTDDVLNLAAAQRNKDTLWYRSNIAVDFMALRVGLFTGKPSFPIEIPKGEDVNIKDPLLAKAKELVKKYQILDHIPYLLNLREIGSVVILGDEKSRYGLAHRLLLDILMHHRPDEVEVFVLSAHPKASELWGWLRWAPHCKVFDDNKEFDHLAFGNQSIKIFLGRFAHSISKSSRDIHLVLVIDVDGIQQYDDNFIADLITNAPEWNVSLLFVGGKQSPRLVRGVVKFTEDHQSCIFVDTKIDVKDKEEKEYHTLISLDELPDIRACERASRAISGIKLLSSAGDALLSPNTTLFNVLGLGKEDKLTFKEVVRNWGGEREEVRHFENNELLQFPIGLAEKISSLESYCLNLLEARFNGLDAYHTMLIGTTGSGKSEFIKSLILAAAYKYPPQYLNFFCMDFKGGSTVDQLKALPHVIGVMTNLEEVMAQRGLIALRYEIDRRQAKFNEQTPAAKDIWEYNADKSPNERMPHLVLILDEFTRGLEMLNTPEYDLQDLLEKRLVPQGRSLGIFLLLANQVANNKVERLLPNTGWRIALRVASQEQMHFIDSGLKPPKFAGRGYIRAVGEEPVEFQSGYSGNYVQYTNIQIKPKNIPIKELLPNGVSHFLKPVIEDKKGDEFSKYLEMNQVIDAITTAQKKMRIESSPKIYMPPLKNSIEIGEIYLETGIYRKFSSVGWDSNSNKNCFLHIPIGFVDLAKKCQQYPLILDFLENNPNLLMVGGQTDLIQGLRSILFSLLVSHSPSDVNVYMLEFGKGLSEIPCYPHIGDIVDQQDTERIARTIQFFEAELSRREEKLKLQNVESTEDFPHLFLIINNIAGLVEKAALYTKVFQFISQESFRHGIHIILTALPKATGTRVSSIDLKTIKSRIVFPSINHDDYWDYLDVSERKLVKLTKSDEETGDITLNVSRAHWLRVGDPNFGEPVELQIALPCQEKHMDKTFADQMMNAKDYNRSKKIDSLQKQYIFENRTRTVEQKNNLFVGVQWIDLREFSIPFAALPSIWGVSGPRESGKTNFLHLLIEQYTMRTSKCTVEVFSIFPSQLTEYCKTAKGSVACWVSQEHIRDKLKTIMEDMPNKKQINTLFVFDDINLLWERDDEMSREIIKLLENLANIVYDCKEVMLVASFNYSQPLKLARSRDALIRSLHDNKTGICLGYEGDWLINSYDLINYKKNVNGLIPPGRGIFVRKGKEVEVQTFLHEWK